MNIEDIEIKLDIANEVCRLKYSLDKNLVEKIQRRLQRKHKIKVSDQEIQAMVQKYEEIYSFAAKELPNFTMPSKSEFASPANINSEPFEEKVGKKYSTEDKEVISKIIGWVVYWEYLR